MITLKTKYTNIEATDQNQLDKFEYKLLLKGKLKRYRKEPISDKIDGVIERIAEILDIDSLESLNFDIMLFADQSEVAAVYYSLYGKHNFSEPAFMSRERGERPLIHESVEDTCIKVLSHEITHGFLIAEHRNQMDINKQHEKCWHVERNINEY